MSVRSTYTLGGRVYAYRRRRSAGDARALGGISRAHSLARILRVRSLAVVRATGAPAAKWIAAAVKARRIEMVAFMVYGVNNVLKVMAVNAQ